MSQSTLGGSISANNATELEARLACLPALKREKVLAFRFGDLEAVRLTQLETRIRLAEAGKL